MPLQQDDPASLAYSETAEFVGVGASGLRRKIYSYDYVSLGSLRRVNLVVPPVQDWLTLLNDWSFVYHPVSLVIRFEQGVLLTLNEVLPTDFSILGFADASKISVALFALASPQVVYARAKSVAFSEWDRFMPACVRSGTPSSRMRARLRS
jgi:hypothetical protein